MALTLKPNHIAIRKR